LEKFPSQAKRPVIAHRLIFSMSREQHDPLVAAGINPDQVLQSSLKKVMRKFAEKFHPGDAIGFAYGLHHDTELISRYARARRKAAMSGAAHRDSSKASTNGRWIRFAHGSIRKISGG
jgi:hypothetical protein